MPGTSKLGFTIQPYTLKAPYGITNFDPQNNKIITPDNVSKNDYQIRTSYDGKNAMTNMPRQGKKY